MQATEESIGSAPAQPMLAASRPEEDFVYAISHDLRGPLLNFQGFLRRLRQGCELLRSQAAQWDLTAEQRQTADQLLEGRIESSLAILDRNARRMERLLQALLELSRAGREPPHFQPIATGELVRTVAEEFRLAAEENSATLRVEPLPNLYADPGLLEQIFRHLLSNAVKFLSPHRSGEIAVGGGIRNGEAVCWVKDNGIGIKPQDRERIFTPFGRVQEIEAPGEGVGLATVRKLVQRQGGQLWAESVHGQGSTFQFSLPGQPDSGS